MEQNTKHKNIGRTVWDFFYHFLSNGKIFYPFLIGFFIGLSAGVFKIVDIQVTWENGGVRIRNIEPQLAGEWELINTITESSYKDYDNMIIVWRMYLEQNGKELSGRAIKVKVNNETLNGSAKSKFEITSGKIEDNKITIFFDEGKNSGKFEWLYSKELDLMKGKFTTSAALSNGLSIASKL